MLASSRCRELAVALQSLATRISYEDVRLAATTISQCATNVLSVRSLHTTARYGLISLLSLLGDQWALAKARQYP